VAKHVLKLHWQSILKWECFGNENTSETEMETEMETLGNPLFSINLWGYTGVTHYFL